jgi:hypothetical protein
MPRRVQVLEPRASVAETDTAIERGEPIGTHAVSAVADLDTKVGSMMDAWHKLLEFDLPALNQQLKQAGFPEIKTEG